MKTLVRITCRWCDKSFNTSNPKAKSGERVPLTCPSCGKRLPASKIEYTGNVVGRKHLHKDYKQGDIAG